MGILLGLTAALCWGIGDFLAGFATRQIGTYRTLFFMQIFGVIGLSLFLINNGQLAQHIATTRWQVWLWAIVVALCNMVSSVALYRSFEVGVMTVVSPIAASYAALTVVLSLLSGEHLTITRTFGVIAAIIGVVFSSMTLGGAPSGEAAPKRLADGVGWALIASVGYGVTFWLLGFQVTPHLGGITPVWLIRIVTMIALAVCAGPARQSLRIPTGKVWWIIAGIGVFDTAAFVANTVGITIDQVAIVNVLASLYSSVTVVLSWLILRERLQWNQWLGIGCVFMGIVLVGI